MDLSNLLEFLYGYFSDIWNFILAIGQFSAYVSIVVGFIMWLTEYDSRKSKSMIIGGIILLIVLHYFSMYPPSFITS